MDEKHCRDCQYYLQHFTLDKRKFFRVYCGHRTLNTAKRKKPDANACENYIQGSAQEEEAFVSKEYLSKELLQYMLGLELLPEIENRG